MLKQWFVKLIKEIQFHTPLRRYFFPNYAYNFTPPQLFFLCQCLEDTKHIAGNIAEIGCACGSTTIFLNKYLDAQDIQKKYYTVDTFSGFVAEDVGFEVANRDKAEEQFDGFRANKKKWFDGTMQDNNISRVCSIQADVNKYDLTTLGPLSFILLDVDLYRPMKKALPELYQALSPGGIMVLDDCNPSKVRWWDGALQAYTEFMKEKNRSIQIVHGKLGVVKKDA